MNKIKLTQGKYAIVDDEDFDFLNQWKWYCLQKPKNMYVCRTNEQRKSPIKMHRLIMKAEEGQIIDHINGDGLDNRKENLRLCTQQENNMNRKIASNNISGYKGVSFDKRRGKWKANIRLNRKSIWLGYHDDIKEAAKAYNEAAIKYFGEFAYINKLLN